MALAAVKAIHPLLLLTLLIAASIVGVLLLPPIPQDQAYHLFADRRTLCGIPNFWNVASNIPFLAVGAAGMARAREGPAAVVLFLGFFLTGIGSAYYHLVPRDGTLFWDRLPMTLAFATIFALVVEERIGPRAGTVVLWPMLALGIASLFVWLWAADLRLYFWAQFVPTLALIVLSVFYPAKYSHARYWVAAVALYVLAKLFEFSDHAIYSVGHILSGHTLKHLFAAAAGFAILRYLRVRRPIA
jgi:Ceramidase